MLFRSREDECIRLLGTAQGDSVIVLGKVGMWLLVLLFNVCVQHHHTSVRNRGYLRFYRDTRVLKHLPLTVHSTGMFSPIQKRVKHTWYVVACSERQFLFFTTRWRHPFEN